MYKSEHEQTVNKCWMQLRVLIFIKAFENYLWKLNKALISVTKLVA